MHKNCRDTKYQGLIFCFKHDEEESLHEQNIFWHTTVFLFPLKHMLSPCPILQGLLKGYSLCLERSSWLASRYVLFTIPLITDQFHRVKREYSKQKSSIKFYKMKQKWEEWGLFHCDHKPNCLWKSLSAPPCSSQTKSLLPISLVSFHAVPLV